jgi:hypothetical protein
MGLLLSGSNWSIAKLGFRHQRSMSVLLYSQKMQSKLQGVLETLQKLLYNTIP